MIVQGKGAGFTSTLIQTYTAAVSDSNPNTAGVVPGDAGTFVVPSNRVQPPTYGYALWFDHTADTLTLTFTVWIWVANIIPQGGSKEGTWVSLATSTAAARRQLWDELSGIATGACVFVQCAEDTSDTVNSSNPCKLYATWR